MYQTVASTSSANESGRPLTAARLAERVGVPLLGTDCTVARPAPIGRASAGDLSFVRDAHLSLETLQDALENGAVVFVPTGTPTLDPGAGAVIPVANPRREFACAVRRYFVSPPRPGVSPSAEVHSGAQVDPSATIGQFSVVREGAFVGPQVEIRDHVVIGENVVIGRGSLIKSHAVIGEEGFGIEQDEDGNNFLVPQVGSVVLGAEVQVGSLTCICAGALDPTRVGDHTKISDGAHIAHNCQLGRNVIVTAGVVFSGSVSVGDGAWVGPNATIRDGLSIGAGAFIGIGSNVVRSIPAGQTWAGNPARPFPTDS